MFYQNPSNYTLTLFGMYEYDKTIFDNIIIPEGMDKDALINTIMAECGENEVRYPNIPILKVMIQTFFKTYEYKYQKLFETLNYDYEPLENYNVTRTRSYSRTETGNDTRNMTSENSSETTVENEAESNATSTDDVSAYNSTDYVPSTKNTQGGNSTSGGTENVSGNGSEDETTTYSHTIIETEDSNDFGDNSARSAMYAILEQRELVNFNLYRIIASDFEDEITIPIYSKSRTNLYTGGIT